MPWVERGTPGGALERRRVQEEVRGRLFAGRGRPVRIGRFVVLRRLGSGGMGVVYAARDAELERDIAVKLLQPTHDDEGSRQRLLQEARAMAKLSHPNVVAVHEVGEHEGQVFVAMELVRGETLRAWVQTQPRSWRQVLAVMLQVARGLAAAHEAGIVHRDVKPENALVAPTRSGFAVSLVDFLPHSAGEAGSAESTEAPLLRLDDALVVTKTGALIGTPAYMAPELWEGRAADARSDQFAFCVTLWELLYGERPQVGETGPQRSGSQAAPITQDDRGPSQRGTKVPGWLRRVVERGLSVDPKQRWPSMDALLQALERGQTRARLRRGLGVAALLGLGVATFAGVQELERRSAVAACERGGESIAEVWNEDAREKLRDALIGTGVNHAEVTAEKVMPWLDEHADAWKRARVEACLDAEVRRMWDADLLDRAVWCLDDRRLALGALVNELTEADVGVVNHAVPAAVSLQRVDPCRDEALLVRLPAPPTKAREEVQALRAELSRAEALQRTGAYEEGLRVANEALGGAERLGWPPLVAAARLQLGKLHFLSGEWGRAESTLEQAYFEAADAGGVEEMFAAAAALVGVVGNRLERYADGERWNRHADVARKTLTDPAGLREAGSLNNLGLLRHAMGAYEEAARSHERALGIREQVLGPVHPEVGSSLESLALVRVSTGAYADAVELHGRALSIRETVLGPDHPAVAQSINNLAVAHHLAGASAEAARLLERALAIREKALGPEHPDVAGTLDNLAVMRETLGEYDDAARHYERALEIFEKVLGPEHPRVASSLDHLGGLRSLTGDYAEAGRLRERALGIREKALGPEHLTVAMSLFNLGNLRYSTKAYADAGRLHERALRIREQVLGPEHSEVAHSLNSLAGVQYVTGDYDEAARLYERALGILEQAVGPGHRSVAFTLVGLAYALLAQDRPADAATFSERAVNIREGSTGPATHLAEARFLLARALVEAGESKPRAIALAEQARDAYRDAGDPHGEELDKVERWLRKHGRAR